MPAINPNDYNIDNFNSQNLGPISVSDFRSYVLNHNLQGMDPLLSSFGFNNNTLNVYAPLLFNPTNNVQDIPDLSTVSFTPSVYNNNTSPRPNNLKQNIWVTQDPFYGSPKEEETFEVTTKALENPGSIDSWLVEGGFETSVFTIRNFVNLNNNEYGPTTLFDYSNPDFTSETTGYKQYPTTSLGNGASIIGSIVARTLGFSSTSFIDFPSDLQDISQERRLVELQNRINLNLVEDTLGYINLNPLGLLSGQNLIVPSYTITRPKNFPGRVAQFTASLVDLTIPVSIIPGNDKTQISSNSFQSDLIDFTGKGQRDLLFFNVYSSKYTPTTLVKGWDPDEATKDTLLSRIGQFFDDLGKQGGDTYLSISDNTVTENESRVRRVGNFLNNLISPTADKGLIPTPETSVEPNDPFVTMGADGQLPALEGLDNNSSFVENKHITPPIIVPGTTTDYYPNKTTLKPSPSDTDGENSNFDHIMPSTNQLFDWRDRNNSIAKRGLLKYTQDMINRAEDNGHRGGARFIGRFDSDSNIIQANTNIGGGSVKNTPKHKEVSKGNLVRSTDNSHYCRSWSTRNPYQNHYDLIRADKLYRLKNENNYLSVLEESGHVKIAPDREQKGDFDGEFRTINKTNEIKRYMFSIENLAWKDAPEKMGLPDCEIGPNGGRLMWFPPYDINFTENVSVSWETNTFLGRGEPIYTYNNTERKGTLSWTIITDHPSILNQFKGEEEEKIYRFFAGCGLSDGELLSLFFTESEILEIESVTGSEVLKQPEGTNVVIENNLVAENNEVTPKPNIPLVEPPIKTLEVYFRNARRDKLVGGVRAGEGRNITEELSVNYALDSCTDPDCFSNSGEKFNRNQTFANNIENLIDFLATEQGQPWGVEIIGTTSGAANKEYNQVLSRDRAESVYTYLFNEIKTRGQESSDHTYVKNGVTGTTKYVYDQQNMKVQRAGWVCNEGSLCDTEISKIVKGKFTYKQKQTYINPTEIQKNTRFIVIANSEGGNSDLEDEDTIFVQSATTEYNAMGDRKVNIRLFLNTDYVDKSISNEIESSLNLGEPPLLEDEENIQIPTTSSQTIPFLSPFEQQYLDSAIQTQENLNTLNDLQQFEGFAGKDLIDRQRVATQNAKENTGTNQPIDESPIGEDVEDSIVSDQTLRTISNRLVQKLYNECDYFEKIKKDSPFVYAGIADKIKHFHPSFHSTTPEGLNSRLTFLHQCTRQGPNIKDAETKTNNMAFGRPPICVLRIGDFWYTKIVIDSYNVTYEPLVWDMNPEGIGVQPMIAKVDLNFSMIGGSSLSGPISQLQNAVSYNFFANTSVYNSRKMYTSVGNYRTLEDKVADVLKGTEIGFGAFKSEEQVKKTEENKKTQVVTETVDPKQEIDTAIINTLALTPLTKLDGGVGNELGSLTTIETQPTETQPTTIDPIVGLISEKESEAIVKTYPKAETPKPKPKPKKVMDILELENIIMLNLLYKQGPSLNNLNTLINGYVINKGGVDNLGKYLSEHEFEEFNMVIYILVSDVVGFGFNQWGADLITRRNFGGEPRAKDLANAISGQLTQTAKVNKGKIKISIELLSSKFESSKFKTPQKVSVKLKNDGSINF